MYKYVPVCVHIHIHIYDVYLKSFPNHLLNKFVGVQSRSHVQFFATPWTVPCQVSLPFIISQSWLMSIELVMPSKHLILCRSLLLLLPIPPSIRIFCNESALHIRWPKYWSFSFCISPSKEYSRLISFRTDWFLSPCKPRDSQESSPAPV